MKASFLIAIRLLALIVLYFVCFAVVSGALLSPTANQSDTSQAGIQVGEASTALVSLLAISFLSSAVLAYVIIRSRWSGWKLVLTIFFVFYGVTTFMPQLETAFFLTRLPPGMLPRLFLAGAIIAAVFSPLAVLVMGKRKPGVANDEAKDDSNLRLNMAAGEWAVKLSLIIIAYVIIYFSFGYFIAWKSAAVREYYGGGDPGSFFTQIRTVMRDMPLLMPLQVVRALLWAAIAVPVIRMMKGRRWEAGLAVALLFGVVGTSLLLLPNPLMPREVRLVHLLETASSNFLFGWLLVLIFLKRRRSERETAHL